MAGVVLPPGKYFGPFPVEGTTGHYHGEGVALRDPDGDMVLLPAGKYLGPFPEDGEGTVIGRGGLQPLDDSLPNVEQQSMTRLRPKLPSINSKLTDAVGLRELKPFTALLKRIEQSKSAPRRAGEFADIDPVWLANICKKTPRKGSFVSFKGGGRLAGDTTFNDSSRLRRGDQGIIDDIRYPTEADQVVTLACSFPHCDGILLTPADVTVL